MIGIVGRDGGYTAQVADACVIIPTVNPKHTTPHAEAFQAVVWHLLVSHPRLQAAATKWESVDIERVGQTGRVLRPRRRPESQRCPRGEALSACQSRRIAGHGIRAGTAVGPADCGYLLIGATNQPDVARGTQTREAVEAINRRLMEALPLLEILVCCHDDRDQCDCRKPQPGMLLRAAARHGIDLSRSFIIGDRWRDIEAGRRAGCCTIWIDYNYKETWPVAAPDFTVCSLAEAVKLIPIENRS